MDETDSANRDSDMERQVVLALSDWEVLEYLVDRTTDIVNKSAKEREDRWNQRLVKALSIAGIVITGGGGLYLSDRVSDLVREEFAALDTIAADVHASAALSTLNSPTRDPAQLAQDERTAEELVIRLSASSDVARTPLAHYSLLPMIRALGPNEQWRVLNQLHELLGESLIDVDSEGICSAMATNYGVHVLGAASESTPADREHLDEYLACLTTGDGHGEVLFWRLLDAHQRGRKDSLDVRLTRVNALEENHYGQFLRLAQRFTDDFAVAEWRGSNAKQIRDLLSEVRQTHSDLLVDPVTRELRNFEPLTGTVVVGAGPDEGRLETGDGTVDGLLTDRWEFSTTPGDSVVIDAMAVGGAFDMFIFVRPPTGEVVQNDDYRGLDSRCRIPSSVAGTYSVFVHDRFAGGGGAYLLTVRPEDKSGEDEGVEDCIAPRR